MADANYANFSKRTRAIEKQHRKLSRGYVQLVEREGILVPKSRRTLHRKFPVRGLAMLLALFLVFKGFLMVQLGTSIYDERVAKLSAGSQVEQIGAWVMRTDPISQWIAQQIKTWI
ncbi:hypothetical protein [Aliiroseovarius crassostreae]|uniref:hypothetical protein n=1 Tax=Aliiroseovarius crassostreae TaxID=154981 RepID=UPI003C7CF9CE